MKRNGSSHLFGNGRGVNLETVSKWEKIWEKKSRVMQSWENNWGKQWFNLGEIKTREIHMFGLKKGTKFQENWGRNSNTWEENWILWRLGFLIRLQIKVGVLILKALMHLLSLLMFVKSAVRLFQIRAIEAMSGSNHLRIGCVSGFDPLFKFLCNLVGKGWVIHFPLVSISGWCLEWHECATVMTVSQLFPCHCAMLLVMWAGSQPSLCHSSQIMSGMPFTAARVYSDSFLQLFPTAYFFVGAWLPACAFFWRGDESCNDDIVLR